MTRSYKCKKHPFMEKCLIIERRMLLLHNNIEGQYVVTGNLSFLSIFFFLSISKSTKKSVNIDFRLYKPVRITANKIREFSIRKINIKERWGMVKLKPSFPAEGN